MKCAIMQPTYLPWIGYFDLIDQVDKFVFLDSVQLTKQSWQVRNRIKSPDGELFLSIPTIRSNGLKDTKICEAIMQVDTKFKDKHLKSIKLLYRRALYFDEVYEMLFPLINNNETNLSEFNINIIKKISNTIGIKSTFLQSSKMTNIKGKKDGMGVSICNEICCNEYISSQGSAEYIEKENPGGEFSKNKIELFYHNYCHPKYNQLFGDFLSHMSIIDLLFNCGLDNSLDIIKEGRVEPINYINFNKSSLFGGEDESDKDQ